MKKFLTSVFMGMLIVFGALTFSACGGGDTVKSIRIDTMPKVNYVVGDDVLLEGGTFIATFDDGTEHTFSLTLATPSITRLNTVGQVTVTVTYKEATANFTVTVEKGTLDITLPNAFTSNYSAEANPLPNPFAAGVLPQDAQVLTEYKPWGADVSAYTSDAPVNAGTYAVRISITGSANYHDKTLTTAYTIHKSDLVQFSQVASGNRKFLDYVGTTIAYGNSYDLAKMWNSDYTGESLNLGLAPLPASIRALLKYEYKPAGGADTEYAEIAPNAQGKVYKNLDAGAYDVRVKIFNDNNINDFSRVVTLNILKTELTEGTHYSLSVKSGEKVTPITADDRTVEYTGLPQELQVTFLNGLESQLGLSGQVTYTKSTEQNYGTLAPTDVNAYNVLFSINGGNNYVSSQKDIRMEIVKQSVPIPALNDFETNYTGQAVAYTINEAQLGEDTTYTIVYKKASEDDSHYVQEVPTAKGEYTVKLTFNRNIRDTLNYQTQRIETRKYVIVGKPITQYTVTDDTKVYDGAAFVPQISLPEGTNITRITYSLRNDPNNKVLSAPTNAGEYTAYIEVNGGDMYADCIIDVNFEITQATYTQEQVGVTPQQYTYTGSEFAYDTSAFSLGNFYNIGIEYKLGDAAWTTQAPTLQGVYTVRVTLTNETNLNYVSKLEFTTTLTIKGQELNLTASDNVDNREFTYTGSAQTPNVINLPEGVTYTKTYTGLTSSGTTYNSDTAPTDAGEYTMLAKIDGGVQYGSQDFEVLFQIKARPLALNEKWLDVTKVYDGNAYDFSAINAELEENVALTVTYKAADAADFTADAPVNAGNYSVKFTLIQDVAAANVDTNLEARTVYEGTLSITKTTYVFDADFESKNIFDYDGNGHAAVFNTLPQGMTATITYNLKSSSDKFSTAPINAGEYDVEIAILGGNNYNDLTVNQTLVINKVNFTPTASHFTSQATVTYNGNAHPVTMDLPTGVTITSVHYVSKVAGTYDSDTAPTNVGEYTATVVISGGNNYNDTETTFEFTINKADLNETNVTFANTTVQYTGTAQGLKNSDISVPAGVEIESITYNTTDSAAPVEVGTYTATVSLLGGANYNNATLTTTFTVAKADITPEMLCDTASLQFDYDGTAKSPTLNTIEGTTVSSLTYTGTNVVYDSADAPTDAGSYDMNITVEGGDNYNGFIGSIPFTINKIAYTFTPTNVSATAFDYTGEALAPTLQNLPSDMSVTNTQYQGTGSTVYALTSTAPTNAGTYTAIFTLSSKNYTNTDYSVEFTINPSEYTFTAANVDQTSFTADGNAHAPTLSLPTGLNQVSVTYQGRGETTYNSADAPTVAGTYTAVYTLSGDNYTNTSYSVDFEITPAVTP